MPNDKDIALTLQRKYFGNPQGLAQHLVTICLNQIGVVREVLIILDRFSTFDVGYRFLNLLPSATLLKLTNTKNGKVVCEMLLRWLLDSRPLDSSEAAAPGIDWGIELKRLKDAVDNSSPQADGKDSSIPFANLKEGENIRLSSPLVVEKLTKIAADYYAATGKTLTITDGDRTALEQAYMMIRQIRKGELGLYTQKQAAAEVKKVYDAGRGKSDDQIAQDIGKVIQNQIDSQGIFISRHLKNRGADIRSRDMTTKERNAFNQAAKNHGVEVLKEGDHLHLQF